MVCCFAPGCSHKSSHGTCSFYRFPTDVVKRRVWTRVIRRADRKPGAHSRICSCHFPKGKGKMPVLFVAENVVKLNREDHSYCLRGNDTHIRGIKEDPKCLMTEGEADPFANEYLRPLSEDDEEPTTSETVEEKLQSEQKHRMQLEIQLEESKAELKSLKDKESYCRDMYSASQLSDKVLRMETGLPDRDTFRSVCEYVARFEGSITYPEGWSPKTLSLEDQVFITLMKLRHSYTHLHLAALFHCSITTVRNVIGTFIDILHKLLFKDTMITVPGREKNKTSLPSSFRLIRRMILDCTDITIAMPKKMDIQNEFSGV
nr:52 kDa repressor of the inhibitor of the protein kinase-like [Pseudochaenichthys georgianus]